MNYDVQTYLNTQNRNRGFAEQGLWALLAVVVVVQIACGFSAGADLVANNHAQTALVQPHDGTLLAKR